MNGRSKPSAETLRWTGGKLDTHTSLDILCGTCDETTSREATGQTLVNNITDPQTAPGLCAQMEHHDFLHNST